MAVIDLSIIRAQFEKQTFVSAVQRTTRDLLSGRLPWNPSLTVMKGKRIYSTVHPSFPPDLCSHPPVPLAGVYASTYLTANWTKALCDEYDVDYKVRGHVSPWCIHTHHVKPTDPHAVTPTSCIGCRSRVPHHSSSQLITAH